MANYRITMSIKSSIRSKFQSDTIFGHICWAYRYLNGKEQLEKWLHDYAESPTLISNAFPKGFMPKPTLPPLSYNMRNKLSNGKDLDAGLHKKHKKITFVREDWFWKSHSHLTSEKLFIHLNELLKEKDVFEVDSILVTHNRFNRHTGRADEGGLFDTEEDFFLARDNKPLEFSFYIKSETLNIKMIEKIMNYISLTGFGADKSVGKGQIEIINIVEIDIPMPSKVNSFISLANFIPAGSKEVDGYYKTVTKFGKLAEEYAVGGNPFKKPIIMLEAGALIKTDNFSWENYYGKLQNNIHSSSELNIVQYGYAFPIPVYYEEEDNDI